MMRIIKCLLIGAGLLFVLVGCSSEKITNLNEEAFQSVEVMTYDLVKKESRYYWAYSEKDTGEILDFFINIKGKPVDAVEAIEHIDTTGPFYGVYFNMDESVKFLIAGDYIITHEGDYYLIDGHEAELVCKTIKDNERVFEGVHDMINHRYLSLIEGEWDTTFMEPSGIMVELSEAIHFVEEEVVVDSEEIQIEFTLVNNSTSKTFEFGTSYGLEAEVEGTWYYVSDMAKGGIDLAFDSMLIILEPDQTYEQTVYLKYYQPLPSGLYRITKEVAFEDDINYIAVEFRIE